MLVFGAGHFVQFVDEHHPRLLHPGDRGPVDLVAIDQLVGFLAESASRIARRSAGELAPGGEHLLEHALHLDIHLHAGIAKHADDRGFLLGGDFDLPVFQRAGPELIAELLAGALALGFGFVIVDRCGPYSGRGSR